MGNDSKIDDVLSIWENGDKLLSAEELCVDCPELIPEVRQRMKAMAAADHAMRPAPAPTPDSDSNTDSDIRISIEGYRLVRWLGGGGQADVYLATFLKTGRQVAVKVLRDGTWNDERRLARLDREAQILAALSHPNIVTILDRGTTSDGRYFLAMDYVAGKSLDKYLADRLKFSSGIGLRDVLSLFLRICDAVNSAHLRGVVHRDLKPSNIMVDDRGDPHILDFGLARSIAEESQDAHRQALTVTGQFLGSLPWASPEQVEGNPDRIDRRTDVYSLGVILYQLLTDGQFPYDVGGGFRSTLNNILTAPPEPPSSALARARAPRTPRRFRRAPICEEVEAVVLKALAKAREERYQSAGELARDIADYLAGRPITALPWSARRRRRIVRRCVLALLLASIATGAAVFLRMPSPYRDAAFAWLRAHWSPPDPPPPPPPPTGADPRPAFARRVGEIRERLDWRLRDLGDLLGRTSPVLLAARSGADDAIKRARQVPGEPWDANNWQVIQSSVNDADGRLSAADRQIVQAWEQAIASWRKAQLAGPAPVTSASLRAAFEQHRQRIVAAAATTSANARTLPEARDALGRLQQAIARLDVAFEVKAPTTRPAQSLPWQESLPQLSAEQREQALRGIVSSPVWQPDPANAIPSAALAAYQQWTSEVDRIDAALAEIDRRLSRELSLEPKTAAGQSGFELYRSIGRLGAMKQVAPLAPGLVQRVEALIQIRDAVSRDALLAAMKPGCADEVLLAAWRRLEEDRFSPRWPATTMDLEREFEFIARLRALKRNHLAAEIAQTLQRRVEQCGQSVPLAELLAVLARKREEPALDLSSPQFAWLAYDLRLRELKSRPPAEDAAAQEAIKQLLAAARAVSHPLEKAIESRLKQTATGPVALAAQEPARWNHRMLMLNAYSLLERRDGDGVQLEFVPVPDRDKPAFYISATEVTLGQFLSVVSLYEAFPRFQPLLPDEPDRPQPVFWQWSGKEMRIADPLLPIPLVVNVSREAKDYPLQYISPAGAVEFASLLKCRLPTSSEWDQAYRKYQTDLAQPGPRDFQWKLRREPWTRQTTRNRTSERGVVWLDDGVFCPEEVGSVPRHEHATAWTDAQLQQQIDAARRGDGPATRPTQSHDDDETVLFRRITYTTETYPRDGRLKDLVGNVAEYVFDGEIVPENPSSATSLAEWLAAYDRHVRVVGGSALSAPQLSLTRPYPVDARKSLAGFSDVGFRLVYDATEPPAAVRLARVLGSLEYVGPAATTRRPDPVRAERPTAATGP